MKRRHKDDIKHFYNVTQQEDVSNNNEDVDSLAQTGAALEEMQPLGNADQVPGTTGLDRRDGAPPDATPSVRPQRQRFTPRHLKDYVLKRINAMKGGE